MRQTYFGTRDSPGGIWHIFGSGLVITAAHVVGRIWLANPSVVIAGKDLTARAVKQGDFNGVDLHATAGCVTAACEAGIASSAPLRSAALPRRGRSHGDPPEMLPPEIRQRFGTSSQISRRRET